jgi:hypothetical protein
MDEETGAIVLRHAFEAAGLRIEPSWSLAEEGLPMVLDGFDPDARIGFEYITAAAGDRKMLSPDVLAELERRIACGELAVLLVDEADVVDASDLELAASRFLERARGACR